jgi:hypothetical protein
MFILVVDSLSSISKKILTVMTDDQHYFTLTLHIGHLTITKSTDEHNSTIENRRRYH